LIYYKRKWIEGNAKFSDGQLVTMELNCDTGTLHFFIDNVQQPVFVHGIKEPVKFWV
jgi:phosphoribosyl-AMP cyclohydrolase